MTDTMNMTLDEIIQQNRASRSRGRGNGNNIRGRGGGRGGPGQGRGRGGRGGRGGGGRSRGRSRSRSQSRPGTPAYQQDRSRSRGPRGRSQSRSRSQSRARSRSRQMRTRSASRSRSQLRGLTPRGRAGLEQQDMPPLVWNNSFNRGGGRGRLRRSNSIPNLQGSVHSRLGMMTRRGAAMRGAANLQRPLAVPKRGISKRGRGFTTANRYSNIGLRSDQILNEQRQNYLYHNNMIKSQTFTRSRNNSFNSASQLTVSVANDFAKRRRNSFGNANYLNKQSLAQLTNQYGGVNIRRGPGSVKSMGSNRSYRSNRSNRSNFSNRSNGSQRSNRSRGRGRGGYRGVGRKFVKQILNPKLQQEIAAIQGKTHSTDPKIDAPDGVNCTPRPASTTRTLHERFASL